MRSFVPRRRAIILVSAILLGACRDAPAPEAKSVDARPSATARAEDELFLPARAGRFEGGTIGGGPGFIERTYSKGALHITVTMTYFPMRDEDWGAWVKTSADNYPQADLGIDPAVSNGFYQCFGEGTARCDLLVQLRSGTHLEIRGAGSKDEVTELARALPLAALAQPGATAYLGAQQH